MTEREEWRAVVGWEGLYEVSSLGRVRSVRRGNRIMSCKPGAKGYRKVTLTSAGTPRTYAVHRLVCEAFHGPAPVGKPWALHQNGVAGDDRAENLYWGSPVDNAQDTIRHGTNVKLNKESCANGHLYTPETVYRRPDGKGRDCRVCREYVAQKRYGALPPLEDGDWRHGRLVGYTSYRCRCDRCRKVWREYQYARNHSG